MPCIGSLVVESETCIRKSVPLCRLLIIFPCLKDVILNAKVSSLV